MKHGGDAATLGAQPPTASRITMTPDLFADDAPLAGSRTPLGAQAVVLRGFALARGDRKSVV